MKESVAHAPSVEEADFHSQLLAEMKRLKVCAVYLTKDVVARTGDATLPDDLLQQTCVRALSKTHQFRGENIFAWTHQIMRSIWYSEMRAQNRRPTSEFLEEEHPDGGFEHAMLDSLMISDIRRACADVTDEEFDLIVRFHCNGETYDEIAQDLSLSLWALRARITKAKSKILARMRELSSEGGRGLVAQGERLARRFQSFFLVFAV